MLLKIRLYGDPCLRQKSVPVQSVGPSERMLIFSMIETLHQHKGIGLAAPQVGINERIIVADVGEGPIALVNPRVTKRSGSSVLEEGCLSIPGVLVNVRRPQDIVVEYINEDNHILVRECKELLAKVIQHEIDHLNGKLIVDYLRWAGKLKFKKQLSELEEQSRKS